jgi:hypothetical protein
MKTRKISSPTTPTITLPALKKGERHASILLDDKGKPAHHLILLPGEMKPGTFDDAQAFAKKCGGVLPTRREQSLLFANCKEQFQHAWYWSGEEHADASASAWGQYFDYGDQDYWRKGSKVRARAVRRVPI